MSCQYRYNLITVAVVWASRILPAGAKGLWEKHLYLDLGDRGCFMSSEEMAQLLGGETNTVMTYRQHLVIVGLLRKGLERGTKLHWFTAFPETCLPIRAANGRTPTAEIVRSARSLDHFIEARGGWPKGRSGVRLHGPPKSYPATTLFTENEAVSSGETGTGVRVGGVRGGHLSEEGVNPSRLSSYATDRRDETPLERSDLLRARGADPSQDGRAVDSQREDGRGDATMGAGEAEFQRTLAALRPPWRDPAATSESSSSPPEGA